MRAEKTDITRTLISSEYIYSHISSLFPESVFLNQDFNIVGLSASIQQMLHFSAEELCGKSINVLEENGLLAERLNRRLRSGFFTDEVVELTNKVGEKVRFSISGFYLGLIADVSSLIVLHFHNEDETTSLERQVQLTKQQVDDFIYRTAHDIRGPLATILGLVGLLKMRKDESETEHFLSLIESHSQRLDEKLHQLVYIAKADQQEERATYIVNFHTIETDLRKVIEQNAFLDFLDFNFCGPERTLIGMNEKLLFQLLSNLLLHLLSLPKLELDTQINYQVEQELNMLTVTITSRGLSTDETIKQGISQGGVSMYTDLLRHSKLTYFFAAQKIAQQFKASIHVKFLTEREQVIRVVMPIQVQSKLQVQGRGSTYSE